MEDIRMIPTITRDILGEGPMWSARQQALFWVDIYGKAISRISFVDGSQERWNVGERIGWIVERESEPGYLVGLKSGFAILHLDPFAVEHIGNPEPDRPWNRLNDARVDREGRLWAGSMNEKDNTPTGALYRLDHDLKWTRCDDAYPVTNGPAFSPDGRVCYHCDTTRRIVYAFDLSLDGELTGRRVFVRFEDQCGYPDGLTTDARGGVWIAHWDGGRISRFHPSGEWDLSIVLPTTRTTSLTFAGPELNRLFVTTAAYGLEDDPLAGSLFEVFTGECGVPAVGFRG